MLYLIHGDQIETSRNKLVELKGSFKEKELRELNGKKFDETAFTQALESSSLFGGDVVIVIEQFLGSAKKREKAFAVTLSAIVAAGNAIDIILYEEKEIDAPTVARLGARATIYLNNAPVVIFQFLDSLRPGNARASLDFFALVKKTEASEIVFALLIRRVRYLIQLLDKVTPEGLQSWQTARLTAQARHFTIDKLVAMHKNLLDIDIAIKTGGTPLTLTQLLEQLIVKL